MALQTLSPFPNLQNQPFLSNSDLFYWFHLKRNKMIVRFCYSLVELLTSVLLI